MATILNIKVDVSDLQDELWDSSGDLSEAFTNSVTYAIIEELKKKHKEQIEKEIKDYISKSLPSLCTSQLKAWAKNPMVDNEEYGSDQKEVPLSEYIYSLINDRLSSWVAKDIQNSIQRKAKEITEELKKRYDIAFASLIVDNMKQQHLLADDRLAELIKPKDNNK